MTDAKEIAKSLRLVGLTEVDDAADLIEHQASALAAANALVTLLRASLRKSEDGRRGCVRMPSGIGGCARRPTTQQCRLFSTTTDPLRWCFCAGQQSTWTAQSTSPSSTQQRRGRMADLILPLKSEYFDAIRSGEKVEEYRLVNEYWKKRLRGRHYGRIVLTLGYPKADDHERRIIKPWRGYVERTIQHPHFGPDPVRVFAINVGA